MGGIFISHSSKNNDQALQLRDWLEGQGWGRAQVFLDLNDLKVGDRWRDVLNAMGPNCEAVIVCLSDAWIRSPECTREFTQAQERGKPIFPIRVAPIEGPIPRFITDLQIADISTGLDSLGDGLRAARILPGSFPWPPRDEPNRFVYRGLRALEEKDAAIFFGRDADIARGLDQLRRMREGAAQQIMVILGASGAGKSSFLRAGLLARLRRDEERFLPLPVIRPERAAITGSNGLLASFRLCGIEIAQSQLGVRALIDAFNAIRQPAMDRFARTAQAAGEKYVAKPPTIVIPVDQAEELFNAENMERDAFVVLMAGVLASDADAVLLLTIRSDAFERAQAESRLPSDMQNLFTLAPMPTGAFKEVIEGPAGLAKPPIKIEPALSEHLRADLDSADALPLLAFTLERLLLEHGADGALALSDYRERLGGVSGAIRSAVTAALGENPGADVLQRVRRAFIPALVQVDQNGIKRRIARMDQIPAASRELVDRLVQQRLLVADRRDIDGQSVGVIEVAHEAVLRQWSALAYWIEAERDTLRLLESVRTAGKEWEDGGHRSDLLVHRGERLVAALALSKRADFKEAFDGPALPYLIACRAFERGAVGVRRMLQFGTVVLAVLVVGIGSAYVQQRLQAGPLAELFLAQKYRDFVRPTRELLAAPVGVPFQDCAEGSLDCPEMVVVHAGSLVMGSADADPEAHPDERPFRRLVLPPFAVSRYEITIGEWRACADAGGCRQHVSGRNWDANRPVTNISWLDSTNYVTWLSRMTGAQYRLLSEAEWEYAARAPAGASYQHTRFSWGNDDPVCDASAPNGAAFVACQRDAPFAVGTFPANRFGLYDLHGNVAEWVEGCFVPYGALRQSNTCGARVVRGGAWGNDARFIRSANRDAQLQTAGLRDVGFRVARTLTSMRRRGTTVPELGE